MHICMFNEMFRESYISTFSMYLYSYERVYRNFSRSWLNILSCIYVN